MDTSIIIREYNVGDFESIATLFYETVHTVNRKDYTQEQVNVWATGTLDFQKWNKSLSENYSIVAIVDDIIVGFGDLENFNYINRLYVHKDYQNKGIGNAICDELEQQAKGKTIYVHASITAKPFFEKRNYYVYKEQQVELSGVLLTNYIMKK